MHVQGSPLSYCGLAFAKLSQNLRLRKGAVVFTGTLPSSHS
jgi:hypothetical protein